MLLPKKNSLLTFQMELKPHKERTNELSNYTNLLNKIIKLAVTKNKLLQEQKKELNKTLNITGKRREENSEYLEFRRIFSLKEDSILQETNQIVSENLEFYNYVLSTIVLEGGNNLNEYIGKIIKIIISDELAVKYSFKGHKNKENFSNHAHVLKLIIDKLNCSKRVKYIDNNFEDTVLKWYNEAEDEESDNDFENFEDINSNHDSNSLEEGGESDIANLEDELKLHNRLRNHCLKLIEDLQYTIQLLPSGSTTSNVLDNVNLITLDAENNVSDESTNHAQTLNRSPPVISYSPHVHFSNVVNPSTDWETNPCSPSRRPTFFDSTQLSATTPIARNNLVIKLVPDLNRDIWKFSSSNVDLVATEFLNASSDLTPDQLQTLNSLVLEKFKEMGNHIVISEKLQGSNDSLKPSLTDTFSSKEYIR
ncbi:hypothetical protein RN001_002317 [Aquatica leii]|uniref:DUF4806 domain-containing protein n=1 Tax=Aquatica leii TaxID=1421715 RepID=A0AAN7PM85_9COLE|nr:hypothetical protein RN001_002317 [Aquatica leii]